jgi:TonB family protein
MSIRLSNTAARRVTGFGLAFEDPLSRNSFFVYRGRLEIGAGKWFTLDIPFMVLTGDPSSLSVKVYGGAYDDATTWGSFPFPSPTRTSRSNSAARTPARPNTSAGAPDTSTDDRSTSALASPVDTKPRPLNGAHPRYTEQARKNGICGMVRLRLLIGADGNVIKVKAVSTLPDFLTEEAIRAAYELKFEPASKAGNPVAYWMPAEVEFNLK